MYIYQSSSPERRQQYRQCKYPFCRAPPRRSVGLLFAIYGQWSCYPLRMLRRY
jgi:hypothetical protein